VEIIGVALARLGPPAVGLVHSVEPCQRAPIERCAHDVRAPVSCRRKENIGIINKSCLDARPLQWAIEREEGNNEEAIKEMISIQTSHANGGWQYDGVMSEQLLNSVQEHLRASWHPLRHFECRGTKSIIYLRVPSWKCRRSGRGKGKWM
jgi:hypothetical protein